MKVFEVLRNDVTQVTEDQVVDRLKSFDWRYEFSNDFRRISSGQRELELIENMVYRLWKTSPQKAVDLWNTYCPDVPANRAVTPSFILRLQSQDKSSD